MLGCPGGSSCRGSATPRLPRPRSSTQTPSHVEHKGLSSELRPNPPTFCSQGTQGIMTIRQFSKKKRSEKIDKMHQNAKNQCIWWHEIYHNLSGFLWLQKTTDSDLGFHGNALGTEAHDGTICFLKHRGYAPWGCCMPTHAVLINHIVIPNLSANGPAPLHIGTLLDSCGSFKWFPLNLSLDVSGIGKVPKPCHRVIQKKPRYLVSILHLLNDLLAGWYVIRGGHHLRTHLVVSTQPILKNMSQIESCSISPK